MPFQIFVEKIIQMCILNIFLLVKSILNSKNSLYLNIMYSEYTILNAFGYIYIWNTLLSCIYSNTAYSDIKNKSILHKSVKWQKNDYLTRVQVERPYGWRSRPQRFSVVVRRLHNTRVQDPQHLLRIQVQVHGVLHIARLTLFLY